MSRSLSLGLLNVRSIQSYETRSTKRRYILSQKHDIYVLTETNLFEAHDLDNSKEWGLDSFFSTFCPIINTNPNIY